MPWSSRLGRRTGRESRHARPDAHLAAPLPESLSELDSGSLEVLEVDAAGRLSGLPRWKDDDSLREPAYGAGAPDAGSLAGVWDALRRGG